MAGAIFVCSEELLVDLVEISRVTACVELALDDLYNLRGKRGELWLNDMAELNNPLVNLGI